MALSTCAKTIAMQWTNLFDTGKLNFAYDYCADIGDGKGYSAGIGLFSTATQDAYAVIATYLSSLQGGFGQQFPGQQPGFPGQQPGFPGQQPGFPGQQPGFPGQQFPGQQPGFPGQQFPGQQPGFPGQQFPGQQPTAGFPQQQPFGPTNPFQPYLPTLQTLNFTLSPDTSLLDGFCVAWWNASKTPLFRQSQARILEDTYWLPSQRLADSLRLTSTLARAQLYDAAVFHGWNTQDPDSLPSILQRVQQILSTTTTNPPQQQQQVTEPLYLSTFLAERKRTLLNPSRPSHTNFYRSQESRINAVLATTQLLYQTNPSLTFDTFLQAFDRDGNQVGIQCQPQLFDTFVEGPQPAWSNNAGLSTGVIAGIVVGVVVFIGLVLGFICACAYRRRKRMSEEQQGGKRRSRGGVEDEEF
ncbi:hypothetical protein HDV05_003203 [Chytridiales sp. JEL 0842]|nr:hypothetical protein HDV05_003203 [Chytridiales sp. JEL 0842]